MLQPNRGHKYAQIHGIVKEGHDEEYLSPAL